VSFREQQKLYYVRFYLKAHRVFLSPYSRFTQKQFGAVWRRLGCGLDAAAGITKVCMTIFETYIERIV
jgi:hypothetical protein